MLSKSQYGFQNNTSTSDVILEVGLLISSNEHINSQLYTGLVLLDFKKAFDTVCHSVLLSKLEHYGIRGEALKLLGSYLTDREQYVAFQNAHSYAVINHYEVFQGSTLGPLLFLIRINDLQNFLNSSPILFADDTCLVTHGSNPNGLRTLINHELNHVLRWTTANKITVNLQKSSILIIPPKISSPSPNIDVTFNNNTVLTKDSVKYL